MDVSTASKRGCVWVCVCGCLCVCVFRVLVESEHASRGEMKNWFYCGIFGSGAIQSDIKNCPNFSFFFHLMPDAGIHDTYMCHMQLKCVH